MISIEDVINTRFEIKTRENTTLGRYNTGNCRTTSTLEVYAYHRKETFHQKIGDERFGKAGTFGLLFGFVPFILAGLLLEAGSLAGNPLPGILLFVLANPVTLPFAAIWLRRKLRGPGKETKNTWHKFECSTKVGLIITTSNEAVLDLYATLKKANSSQHNRVEEALSSALNIYQAMIALAENSFTLKGEDYELTVSTLLKGQEEIQSLAQSAKDLTGTSLNGHLLDLGRAISDAGYVSETLKEDAKRAQDLERFTLQARQELK